MDGLYPTNRMLMVDNRAQTRALQLQLNQTPGLIQHGYMNVQCHGKLVAFQSRCHNNDYADL